MATERGATRPAAERASLAEVARLAGVSMGTVSNVLNHPERVASGTRERVEDAIAKLRFTPHGPARALASGSVRAVGLVLSDLANSLFVDVGRGVEQVASERDVFVYIGDSASDLDREKRYLRMFRESRVLGNLITVNTDQDYREIVADDPGDRPLVLLNHPAEDPHHCTVHTDNHAGGALAARHLVETGRRRLAVVGGPRVLRPVADRVHGFTEALAGTGASIVAMHDVVELTRSGGFDVGLELAARVKAGEIDGVFVVADLVAAGMVQGIAAADPGITLPGDVAVVGYDDNQAAWDTPVQLTTIRQPGAAMGAEGMRRVFEELDSPDHEHRVTILTPELVVRRSTWQGA